MKSNIYDFYSSNSKSNSNSFYLNTQIDDSNRFKKKLLNMTKTLTSEPLTDNSYINRPIIDFKPNMPLYNFEVNNIINPSKMNYIVPVSPPPCHQIKRSYSSSFKSNKFNNRGNYNKSNYMNSFLSPSTNYNYSDYNSFKSGFRKKNLF